MPTLSRVLLDRQTLSTGDAMDLDDALDLGDYATLDVIVTVHAAGEGEDAALVVSHAPRNVADGYLDFPTPISVSLISAGRTWVRVEAFTCFVSWSVIGTLSSGATVSLELVART